MLTGCNILKLVFICHQFSKIFGYLFPFPVVNLKFPVFRMSDTEEERIFEVEVAKNGRAGCKKCKLKCLPAELRIAKIVPNPFGDGKMKNWYHIPCMFEMFHKQRATTKRIEVEDDIIGFDLLSNDDQNMVREKIQEIRKFFGQSAKSPPKKPKKAAVAKPSGTDNSNNDKDSTGSNEDNLFITFQTIVDKVANHPSYLDKTGIIKKFFEKGSGGNGFKGDIEVWCRLLLPGSVKRIYNLQSKQLIKLFSKILLEDHEEMLEHLEQGDISDTISHFYKQSQNYNQLNKSNATIQKIDSFLEHLSKLTKEDDQVDHFQKILKILTPNDLKTLIRLIKHDLRMGAGAKHILEGIHPDAYNVYKASKDIDGVVERCFGSKKGQTAEINIMTPVFPMLAEACKSVEYAMKKCPNGMFSEIKYDGERVQVHKHGNEFKYFSRSLKPVMPHKVAHFKDHIPKAFPHGKDLILDCEILMMDTKTGKPLPFGTLGAHKKVQFQDATVCLFVFDCIFYNGESLINKSLKERKRILTENMIEVPNHVVFSEMEEIDEPKQLAHMIAKVLKLGLEGLVLKDTMGEYKPGKRHWLKVKKDYLFGGAMADSADLVVLGAWYGTGQKGGMMSVFLMGCYDSKTKKFYTVTKVHTGHDDKTLERLQKELKMIKISSDPNKVPSWLNCTRTMVPDFVAEDPKKQPVWEITGAEFSQQHDVHTASGISIRFPRVTKIRHDKTWETATNLEELKVLFKKSKEDTDVTLLLKDYKGGVKNNIDDTSSAKSDDSKPSTPKKRKLLSDDVNSSTSSRDSSSIELPKKAKKNESKNEENVDKMDIDSSSSDESSSSPKNKNKKLKRSNSGDKGTRKSVTIKNPLPTLFEDIKAIFGPGNDATVARHFVGFGGTSLKQTGPFKDATHIVHAHKNVGYIPEDWPKNVKQVHQSWIVDSANKMKLQDEANYAVIWISQESEEDKKKNEEDEKIFDDICGQSSSNS